MFKFEITFTQVCQSDSTPLATKLSEMRKFENLKYIHIK